MAISFASPGAAAANVAFASGTWIISGVTFTAGDALAYIYDDGGATNAVDGCVINGVTAVKVGNTTDNTGQWWKAQGVSAGTGSVQFSCSSSAFHFGTVAACWTIATGEDYTSLAATFVGNAGTFTGDAQVVTATVPAGGAAVVAVGGRSGGAPGNTGNPTTWSNAARVAAMEAAVATGNEAACSGATATAAGSTIFGATGFAGNGWGFGGSNIAALTMSAAGGGGDTFANAQEINFI